MKWRRVARSDRVIDRRGQGGGGAAGGGLPGFPGMGGMGNLARLGIPGLLILVVVVVLSFCNPFGGGGVDGDVIPSDGAAPSAEARDPVAEASPGAEATEDETFEFMNYVFSDVEQTWTDIFQQAESEYPPATLVIFTGQTQSACGGATSVVGPHYCPPDQTVYLDLDFFRELQSRFGASGDFAQAYVLAHEIGHHVQNVTGIMDQVQQSQQQDPSRANDLSVRLELQADCLAGVWAYSVFQQGDLEEGDVEEALGAAAAVGDDRIQQAAQGYANPESFTHGTSEQRMRWFQQGFQTGDPNTCDTYSGAA